MHTDAEVRHVLQVRVTGCVDRDRSVGRHVQIAEGVLLAGTVVVEIPAGLYAERAGGVAGDPFGRVFVAGRKGSVRVGAGAGVVEHGPPAAIGIDAAAAGRLRRRVRGIVDVTGLFLADERGEAVGTVAADIVRAGVRVADGVHTGHPHVDTGLGGTAGFVGGIDETADRHDIGLIHVGIGVNVLCDAVFRVAQVPLDVAAVGAGSQRRGLAALLRQCDRPAGGRGPGSAVRERTAGKRAEALVQIRRRKGAGSGRGVIDIPGGFAAVVCDGAAA